MGRRFLVLFLAVVVAVSTLLSAFSPIVSSDNVARAATNCPDFNIGPELSNQSYGCLEARTISYLRYSAIVMCMKYASLKDGPGNSIRVANANDFLWFQDLKIAVGLGTAATGGIGNEQGVLNCSDPSWIRTAFLEWGATNGQDIACEVGFKRENQSSVNIATCKQSTNVNFNDLGRTQLIESFKNSSIIKNYFTRGVAPTGAMKYLLYHDNYAMACADSSKRWLKTEVDREPDPSPDASLREAQQHAKSNGTVDSGAVLKEVQSASVRSDAIVEIIYGNRPVSQRIGFKYAVEDVKLYAASLELAAGASLRNYGLIPVSDLAGTGIEGSFVFSADVALSCLALANGANENAAAFAEYQFDIRDSAWCAAGGYGTVNPTMLGAAVGAVGAITGANNRAEALMLACMYGASNPDPQKVACDAAPEALKRAVVAAGASLQEAMDACYYGQGVQGSILGATMVDAIEPPDNVNGKVACGIEGIGWIVCPVLTFLGGLADQSFDLLADNFLRIDTSLVETGGGTEAAWALMRTFANVAFVIAFLIIIFSQLTNLGVTNYGVKKLLPRLIISAILVNISYFLCQLAVDLSNIGGFALKDLLDSVGASLYTVDASANASGNAAGWVAIIGVVIIAGVGILLAVSVPVLLASLLAILLIVLTLFARKALIILLIIISPLAFVAFLLPNTEQLFQKWLKLFSSLLLLFPIVAVVFGASGLAANIIKGASTDTMVQITAIAVATIPFFAVPMLLKGALDGVAQIGNAVKGIGQRSKGFVDGAAKRYNESDFGKYQAKKKADRSKLIGAGLYRGTNWNPRNWGRNVRSAGNRRIVNQNPVYNALTNNYGKERGRKAIAKMRQEAVAGHLQNFQADPQDSAVVYQAEYAKYAAEVVRARQARAAGQKPDYEKLREAEARVAAATQHVRTHYGTSAAAEIATRQGNINAAAAGIVPPAGPGSGTVTTAALNPNDYDPLQSWADTL